MDQSLVKIHGLTLIEVLIALAVLSIALTAMIKATSQNIKDTAYLEDKMMAHWVGLKIINEARVGFLKLPSQSDKLTEEVELLNHDWIYEASSKPTENSNISEMTVDVYRKSNHAKLQSLTSYVYSPAS